VAGDIKDPDEHKVGRALADAVVELALSSVPDFSFPVRPLGRFAYGVYSPPSCRAPGAQYVTVLGGERTVIDSVAPATATHIDANHGSHVEAPRRTTLVPLGQLLALARATKGATRISGYCSQRRGVCLVRWFPQRGGASSSSPEIRPLVVERFRLPAYGRSISSFTVCSMRVSQPLRVKTPKRRASANGYAVATSRSRLRCSRERRARTTPRPRRGTELARRRGR